MADTSIMKEVFSMDLNQKLMELKEKLNNMSISEFDEMLERNGINRIKPSIESDYVKCLNKNFSDKCNLFCY